jgi:hypothetical protein
MLIRCNSVVDVIEGDQAHTARLQREHQQAKQQRQAEAEGMAQAQEQSPFSLAAPVVPFVPATVTEPPLAFTSGKAAKVKRPHSRVSKESAAAAAAPIPPKRPPSARILYRQEHRQQRKQENPEQKSQEITKLLGEEFESLSKEEKSSYEERGQQTEIESSIRDASHSTHIFSCPVVSVKLYLSARQLKESYERAFSVYRAQQQQHEQLYQAQQQMLQQQQLQQHQPLQRQLQHVAAAQLAHGPATAAAAESSSLAGLQLPACTSVAMTNDARSYNQLVLDL